MPFRRHLISQQGRPFSGVSRQKLDYAYLIYNSLDRAEFVLLKPTSLLEGNNDFPPVKELDQLKPFLMVNHYSAVKKTAAENSLMAIR